MKKRLFAIVCAMVMILTSIHAVSAQQYIGEVKAKTIALENAGVTETAAIFMKVHLEHEDGRTSYEIEFYSGSTAYDYEIDAISGEIFKYQQEIGYAAKASADNAANYIGETKAKSIALENAGITESQTAAMKLHLDSEHKTMVYDIEFYSGNTKYDYEIDAVSGQILELSREIKQNKTAQQTGNGKGDNSAAAGQYIGEEKAKSIALSAAGVSETDTRKMKAKLDREHGMMVYEVEFKSGQMEYEYEIDAVSGAILESDVEYDD
jgi:uncharacterized membrane protein YkoI